MKKRFKHYTVIFIVFSLIFTAFPLNTVKAADTVNVSYEVTYCQEETRQMLSLINEFRTNGSWYWNDDDTTKTTIKPGELQPLRYNEALEQAAIKRAEEIALRYDHTRPDGRWCYTVLLDEAYGENIAKGFENAYEVFTAWN